MSYKIEVVYENGVLRPVEPLELGEHQRLTVTLDVNQGEEDVIERPYTPPAEGEEEKGLSNIRKRLSKIKGDLSDIVIEEREDRV